MQFFRVFLNRNPWLRLHQTPCGFFSKPCFIVFEKLVYERLCSFQLHHSIRFLYSLMMASEGIHSRIPSRYIEIAVSKLSADKF